MVDKLKILALEPYYGGSHKVFLDNIMEGSKHDWELLALMPRKWKWRMMHSALTFSDIINRAGEMGTPPDNLSRFITSTYSGETPDIIFCTDMLNLAEFKGFLTAKFANIPVVAYFHENQLTYPTHYDKSKDRHFSWINITTALAADAVWFNSQYHMNSFLEAVTYRIKKAPDCRPEKLAERIRAKSMIIPQGIKEYKGIYPEQRAEDDAPLKILWAARWEFDKNPSDFFDALRVVRDNGIDFRLSVIGGNCRGEDAVFDRAKEEFADYIENWGFLDTIEEYESVLKNTDIAVSTAIHEFFGISMAEAVAAGAFPIVPARLAYPEVLKESREDVGKTSFFYDGSVANLAEKIIDCAGRLKSKNGLWEGDPQRGIRKVSKFYWKNVIPEIDSLLEQY